MSNIPKIRFKGFTDAWEQRKLGEICDSFEYGLNAAATDYDGENKYIRITDIDDNSHEFLQNNVTSPDIDFSGAENYKLKQGDILFARTGASVGKTYIYKESDGLVYYAGFLIRGRVKEEYSPEFVFQNTLTADYERFIRITSQRSGQPGVNAQEYASYQIATPVLAEQQKIGAYFSTLDHLITLHQRKCDNMKKIKKFMLQKMFPKKGEKFPEIRFEGFTDAWEQRKLGEIATYRNGKAHEANQLDVGTYELVNLNSISIDGGLKPSGKFIEDGSDTLQRNDLVMVLSDVGHGDLLGRVAIIPENNRYVLNQRVALLRINDDTNTYFLFSIINRYQDYFKKLGAGSSQLNISRGIVENFEVAYPNVAEQRMIADYFQSLDHLITLHQRKSDELKEMKKYMLQNMFPDGRK